MKLEFDTEDQVLYYIVVLVKQNIAHNHRFILIFFVPLILSRITRQSPPCQNLYGQPRLLMLFLLFLLIYIASQKGIKLHVWNFASRLNLAEENLQQKRTFDGRLPLMEYNFRWKTTLDGDRPLMEEDISWRRPFDKNNI